MPAQEPARGSAPAPGSAPPRGGLLRTLAGSCPTAAGESILALAAPLGLRIPSSCGGAGSCHECIVEIVSGADALSPPAPEEGFLRPPHRLACQARVIDAEARIEVRPLLRRPQILTESEPVPGPVAPAVTVEQGTVRLDGAPLGPAGGAVLGLALDLGTTTIVLELVDLQAGRILARSAFVNPQSFGGSDVMHRISYETTEHPGELRRVLMALLNDEIDRLPAAGQDIYEVAAVGNPTMRDLFFGIDVRPLGQRPFQSRTEQALRRGEALTTAIARQAREFGLHIQPRGRVWGGPLVGSHLGADIAAGLLVSGLAEAEGHRMLIDIGTNTEIIAGNRDRLVGASCPAGPAFEGAGLGCGMPGVEGAIERLAIADGRPRYRTIGGGEPEGVCGSGLIDLVAELLRHGVIDPLGRFRDGGKAFTICSDPPLQITRQDLSDLAQAKAANYAGQQILMKGLGVRPAALERIDLAGGFAHYIDPANAMAIGLIPEVPLERVHKLGNAALAGARHLLLNSPARARLDRLVRRVEHIELEQDPEFFRIFTAGCQFRPQPA